MSVKTKKDAKRKPLKPKLSEKEELQRKLKLIKQRKVKALRIKEDYVSTHLCEYLSQYEWQSRVDALLEQKMIILAPAPNGIGKTVKLVNVANEWSSGYKPYDEVSADYPGAVKVDDKYYKPSSLGISPESCHPNLRLRITGEDWNHHLGQVVVPKMKEWFVMEDWHTKKNTSGVEYFWTHKKTGATIELMTHDQDIKLFEGWRGHGWLADEPPKHDIFKAMTRGLAENHGKIFFPSTPLKEAWMLDELILKNRTDVGVMKDLILYYNEDSFLNDSKILTALGLSGKTTKYWHESDGQQKEFFNLILYKDDLGVAAEKYLREHIDQTVKDADASIMQLIFLKKAKDTSLDEKPSRFFGIFKKLIGIVVKEFNKDVHIREVGEGDNIPTNWIVTVMIDFHLGKRQAIGVYACSEKNIHFVIDEVWDHLSPEEIADLIIRWKTLKGWNISEVFIDPLSKGDEKYMKNRFQDVEDSFSIIEERLVEYDITLEVASKDKKSGFTNIKSWLQGVNKIPVLYFLSSLQSVKDDAYGHVYEIQRLCYDDNGEIEKKDDHFMENLYRYTLVGVEYSEKSGNYCHEVVGNNGGDSWMGS